MPGRIPGSPSGFIGPTNGPVGPYTEPRRIGPLGTDPVTPASTINQARTRTPLDIRADLAGAGSLVPPLFGRSRVVGMPEIIDGNLGRILLAYTFCEGIVDGFESLIIDGRKQAVGSLASVDQYVSGGLNSAYQLSLGDTAGIADIRTFLLARLSVYGGGNVPANARIAIELNPDEFRNLPRVEVIARGLPLYDHRTTLTQYSDNAALAIGYIARAWPGMTVDEDSLADWAEECDDPGRRRTIGLVLNRKATIERHLNTLCPIFGASFNIEWQTIKFTPHKRRDRVFTFGPSQIISSSSKRGHGRNNTPDEVLAVGYDPDLNQPLEAYALDSTSYSRLSRVETPGISDPGQLKRLAVERYNMRTVADRYWTGIVTDEGKQIENGDRIGIHDIATDLELDIIVDSWKPRDGDYELSGWRYDEALFSTDTQAGPSAPDTSLPDPGLIPALTVTRVTMGPQFGKNDFIGYEVMRYGASWPEITDYAYVDTFICQVYDPADDHVIYERIVDKDDPDLVTATGVTQIDLGQMNTKSNTAYDVRVAISTTLGRTGPFNTSSIDDHTAELINIFVPAPSYAAVTDGVLVTIPNGTIDEGTREYKFEYRETSGSGLTVFGVAKSEQFLDTTHTGASLPFSYRVTMVRRGGNEISSTETLT